MLSLKLVYHCNNSYALIYDCYLHIYVMYIQAGLGTDEGSSLLLVLEPEAAAMFCQQQILDAPQDASELTCHYLVVDCGGGTVDIAAHKLTKTPDGKVSIEEIHQAHGGPHGGFVVNDEFEKMLEKMFQLTKEGMDELKNKFPRLWIKLIYKEFEFSKCRVDSKSPTPITIVFQGKMISHIAKKSGKDISQLVEGYTRHKVEWDEDDDGLVLPFSTIYSLFAAVISQIIAAIKQVLRKPECHCVEKVILVGGFAESNILFEEVEKEFSPAIVVKKSLAPSLSVLKGAIIYGRDQNMIKSRKMCQSIGIETWDDFNPNIHDENRKVELDGKVFCKNVFTKFVEINESVNTENNIEYSLPVTSKTQDNCSVRIIGSYHNKTFYTDEEACYEIGVITVNDLPKYESGKSREVLVSLNVSGTEITVSAYCDGKTQKLPATLDCIKDKYSQKRI